MKYVEAILKNIETEGLYRYDPNDIDRYIYQKYGVFKNNLVRKALRGVDIFAPILIRKAMRVKKTITPTAYYHVGMAYLIRDKYSIAIQTQETAQAITEKVIAALYDPDTGLWVDPNTWVSEREECVILKKGPCSLPMHVVARLNILLLALWKQTNNKAFLEIAVKSAVAVYRHHNVTRNPDGSASISYYYNSIDVTLNVNAEFLEWIATIPAALLPEELTSLGHGILKLLLREQNFDGSFEYVEKAFGRQYRIPTSIDNHHTAYMLNNLLHICQTDFPTEVEKIALRQCCIQGMDYYLSAFYNEETGAAIYAIELPNRKGEPVSYAEGIVAFCAFLRDEAIPQEQRARIRRLLPKVVRQMLQLVNLKDGSAPCECIFGKWTHMNSIRWGNGPVLQGLFDYIATEQEGFLAL